MKVIQGDGITLVNLLDNEIDRTAVGIGKPDFENPWVLRYKNM